MEDYFSEFDTHELLLLPCNIIHTTEFRVNRHEAELRSGTLTAAEDSAREEIGALRATVASLEAQVITPVIY